MLGTAVSYTHLDVYKRQVSAYTHYFTVAPNDSYDGREAQIVFTEKDGKTTQAVTIYQAPSNALVVARTACKTSYHAGTLTFRKQTDAALTMETEQNWITCTTDGSMLSFSFLENGNQMCIRDRYCIS